jgi:hypothetical protein
MDKQDNGRNDRSILVHGKRRGQSRTYNQPALQDIPLNPRRSGYVLQLILRQHNWQHSSKPKGVSNKTMAERTRFCYWLFDFLRGHPKHFKLDPRSFSGRHVEAVARYWQDEARAGRMSPATIQTYFSFLKTFAGLGWDWSRDASLFGMSLDIGVVDQGDPVATLRGSGTLLGNPSFEQDIRAEEIELAGEASDFDLVPFLSVGFQFRF